MLPLLACTYGETVMYSGCVHTIGTEFAITGGGTAHSTEPANDRSVAASMPSLLWRLPSAAIALAADLEAATSGRQPRNTWGGG